MIKKISLINYVIAIFLLTLLYSGTSSSEVTNSPDDTSVTDEEVRSAYEEYAKNWTGDEYDLRHILVKTHEEALSALKRIQEGESFSQVAAAVSIDPGSRDNGGELGWNLPIFFPPEFAQVVVSLAPNGLTPEPVRTRFGWHLIELKNIRKAERQQQSGLHKRKMYRRCS